MPRPSPPGRRLVAPTLVLAVTAISFAAIFFRNAQPTHPLAAAGIRLAIAAALLSPWTLRAARRGELRGPTLGLAVLAGLAYAVHFGAWVASLELTTVAASVTLVTATPLMLALIGLKTGRDAPSGRLWLALGVSAAGVTLMGVADMEATPDALAGDGLALLGAVGMVGYLLIGRRLAPRLDPLALSGVATAVGAATLFGLSLGLGIPFAPAHDEALVSLILAALLPQMVGHVGLTWALRHTTPTVVGLATLGEPVGAAALAWLWLGEGLVPLTIVACALTLSGVALALSSRGARPEPQPSNESAG